MIFQEAPLLRGGPNWLEKEAAFMLLSEDEKRYFMAFHSQCSCHQSPCIEKSFIKIWDVNSFELMHELGLGNVAIYKVASRINHGCIFDDDVVLSTDIALQASLKSRLL
jgi:hypothetical protein